MKNITPITIDDLETYAPSALATEPMDGVSDKYSFVSTIDAIELIQGAGWTPYFAQQAAVRVEGKRGFQRHVIKFSMGEMLNEVGEERIDLILFNSHDRGSAFKLAMGIYRLVCSNGLVVGSDHMSFSHKHIGFDQDAFLESVKIIAENSVEVAERVEDYKMIEMSPQETNAYASAAAQLVSDKPDELDRYDLTRARRYEDRKDDLWTVYNRTQENIMRGGVRRHGKTDAGRRKKRTRRVSSIDRDIKLNKALWTLTEKMAELKA